MRSCCSSSTQLQSEELALEGGRGGPGGKVLVSKLASVADAGACEGGAGKQRGRVVPLNLKSSEELAQEEWARRKAGRVTNLRRGGVGAAEGMDRRSKALPNVCPSASFAGCGSPAQNPTAAQKHSQTCVCRPASQRVAALLKTQPPLKSAHIRPRHAPQLLRASPAGALPALDRPGLFVARARRRKCGLVPHVPRRRRQRAPDRVRGNVQLRGLGVADCRGENCVPSDDCGRDGLRAVRFWATGDSVVWGPPTTEVGFVCPTMAESLRAPERQAMGHSTGCGTQTAGLRVAGLRAGVAACRWALQG
eukprot:355744-Chlamydomonas_euryale.AAC.2